MKNIILSVSDSEYDFFIQLIKKFDFLEIKNEGIDISKEHQQFVLNRIKSSNPAELIEWDLVKNKFKTM